MVASALQRIVVLVTRMPMNSRENVAINQQPLPVVPHQTMSKRTNGKCSTLSSLITPNWTVEGGVAPTCNAAACGPLAHVL